MSFVVRKSTAGSFLILVGQDNHTGWREAQPSVKALLNYKVWTEHYSNLVPYFQRALEIMENWDDSTDEVPVDIKTD